MADRRDARRWYTTASLPEASFCCCSLCSRAALATPAVPVGQAVAPFATSEVDPYPLAFDADGDPRVGHDTGRADR